MKKMKEPPIGSVIIDTHGSAWQRSPRGWGMAGGDSSWHYSWTRLHKELYEDIDKDFVPTLEWRHASRLGQPPIIVYVPNEDLIVDEDDEE